MKNLILTAVIAILVFIGAEGAHAWSVTVKNNDSAKIKVKVDGYHLFWSQTECEQVVEAGATYTCNLPWGICIERISIDGENKYKVWHLRCDSRYIVCNNIIIDDVFTGMPGYIGRYVEKRK